MSHCGRLHSGGNRLQCSQFPNALKAKPANCKVFRGGRQVKAESGDKSEEEKVVEEEEMEELEEEEVEEVGEVEEVEEVGRKWRWNLGDEVGGSFMDLVGG